jgi:hypothetical protein
MGNEHFENHLFSPYHGPMMKIEVVLETSIHLPFNCVMQLVA